MAKEFLSDVDLKAGLLLGGSAGTSGYVLKSQGAGQKPIWAVDDGAGPIVQPAYVISENVTLGTNRHGLSLTSVEVASGYSVEVPAGATWTIAIL